MNPTDRLNLFDRIGVKGSMPRRVVSLYETFAHKLVGAEDLDHLSRVTLLFEADLGEASYRTRLTIEDLPIDEQDPVRGTIAMRFSPRTCAWLAANTPSDVLNELSAELKKGDQPPAPQALLHGASEERTKVVAFLKSMEQDRRALLLDPQLHSRARANLVQIAGILGSVALRIEAGEHCDEDPLPVKLQHLRATIEDIKQAAQEIELPHDALAEIVELAERALNPDA